MSSGTRRSQPSTVARAAGEVRTREGGEKSFSRVIGQGPAPLLPGPREPPVVC